ncbi:hypothetical protein SK128_005226, partial [Halocaridina rubra]
MLDVTFRQRPSQATADVTTAENKSRMLPKAEDDRRLASSTSEASTNEEQQRRYASGERRRPQYLEDYVVDSD